MQYAGIQMEEDIRNALKVISGGGIILYPTDTVWGIGCDATDSEAVRKIFEIKRRAASQSMLCLVADIPQLERYVDDIPDVAFELIEAAVKPLTIIYSHPVGIAPEALAADGSVGMRITHETFSNALCRKLRKPLISTSANISGNRTPLNFSQIDEKVIESVDYVMNYRRNDRSTPSPSDIIKISDGGLVKVIR